MKSGRCEHDCLIDFIRAPKGNRAPDDGPYIVASAIDTYFADREQRGSKGFAKDRAAARARILPGLGAVELAKLTAKRIRDWHTGLATASKLVKKAWEGHAVDTKDADAVRARRATANRTLTVLKAALNHAFHESRIASDEAWRKAKPFRETDVPIVHFLSDDECQRIVNACDGAFRNIVKGALLTGCRYGELTRMRAGDFNAEAGTITVRESKSGKPRHVALTDEARALFSELTAGQFGGDLIFVRDDEKAWGPSHQQRPLDAASARAKIKPAATFHILRHTYASPCYARCPYGRHRGATWPRCHENDRAPLRAPRAELRRRYGSGRAPALGIVDKSNVTALKAGLQA
jgi:integrase